MSELMTMPGGAAVPNAASRGRMHSGHFGTSRSGIGPPIAATLRTGGIVAMLNLGVPRGVFFYPGLLRSQMMKSGP